MLNVQPEEQFAPLFIRRYWQDLGRRVMRIQKNLVNGLAGEREFDLQDSTGTTWEIKTDKRCIAD